jgi:hypothetical protein
VFASTTTVNANDVFINVAATTAATTYTAGTGYILVGQTQSGASGLALASQYANLSVAGAYTPSIGCSTGSQQAITMAFKGAASPVSGQPIYTPAFVSDFKSIAIGPIYNHTGVFQNVLPHTVSDVCTLGTSCSVTLTGASVFTSSTSYQCVCTDQTSAAACKFAPSSGSAFALTGTGTDVLSYLCAGN